MIPKDTIKRIMTEAAPGNVQIGTAAVERMTTEAEEFIRQVTLRASRYSRSRLDPSAKAVRMTGDDLEYGLEDVYVPAVKPVHRERLARIISEAEALAAAIQAPIAASPERTALNTRATDLSNQIEAYLQRGEARRIVRASQDGEADEGLPGVED